LILYNLTKLLDEDNILYFPVRLDRVDISGCSTSKKFGELFNLPDTPVNCLSANSGEKSSVLIIDQLDVIRWAGIYSNQAIDMCMEIVRESISLNKSIRPVAVLISCITFDYKNDPQIKNWIDKQNAYNIEVSGFPENDIKTIIGENNYMRLSEKQKKMLSIPQYLKLWAEIEPLGEEQIKFQTSEQLIEAAWNYYRKKMETVKGIYGTEITKLNKALVSYLDENSVISAPKRIIEGFSKKLQKAFFSNGILEENNGRILYTHQSFLDFFIAKKTLNEVDTGKSIVEWLGEKNRQFFPRRRQLQQVLLLLKEDNPTRLEKEVIQIIQSDKVRFMLKHLAFAVLSELEDISDKLFEFLTDKLSDPVLKSHIINNVFWEKHRLSRS